MTQHTLGVVVRRLDRFDVSPRVCPEACLIISGPRQNDACGHVNMLLTTQFELARRATEGLAEAGVDRSQFDIVPAGRKSLSADG